MAKSFPDLNKDGEVTKADVLKGRGVEMKKGGKVNWIQSAIKKPGALRASMGVKILAKDPPRSLQRLLRKPGKMGQRARLAQTLSKLKK